MVIKLENFSTLKTIGDETFVVSRVNIGGIDDEHRIMVSDEDIRVVFVYTSRMATGSRLVVRTTEKGNNLLFGNGSVIESEAQPLAMLREAIQGRMRSPRVTQKGDFVSVVLKAGLIRLVTVIGVIATIKGRRIIIPDKKGQRAPLRP